MKKVKFSNPINISFSNTNNYSPYNFNNFLFRSNEIPEEQFGQDDKPDKDRGGHRDNFECVLQFLGALH
jgi:hypothetical protein